MQQTMIKLREQVLLKSKYEQMVRDLQQFTLLEKKDYQKVEVDFHDKILQVYRSRYK